MKTIKGVRKEQNTFRDFDKKNKHMAGKNKKKQSNIQTKKTE